MKQIQRLLIHQGYRCFFCDEPIPAGQASVEHLVATSHGGTNDDENCVVCCRTLNSAFGSSSIKAKLRAVLSQRGAFVCPRHLGASVETPRTACTPPEGLSKVMADRLNVALAGLQKRRNALPGRLDKLRNVLVTMYSPRLSQDELGGLVEALQDLGHLVLEGDKILYHLPDSTTDLRKAEEKTRVNGKAGSDAGDEAAEPLAPDWDVPF